VDKNYSRIIFRLKVDLLRISNRPTKIKPIVIKIFYLFYIIIPGKFLSPVKKYYLNGTNIRWHQFLQ